MAAIVPIGRSGGNGKSTITFLYLAMALKKIKHILTVASRKYSFRAPDIYGSFGSQLGVTKAPNPDKTVYDDVLDAGSFRNGTAIRIKARGVIESNGVVTEARDFTFVVPMEKAKSALATIDSKTVSANNKTYNISSARIPGRRRFG